MGKRFKFYVGKYMFDFDVSALADYTDQTSTELVTKSLFEGKTGSLYRKMTGIKFKEQIQLLDDEVLFQDPSCGTFSPSGDTVFTPKVLTVGKLEIERDWCPDELEDKWTQLLLSAGSTYENLPAEEQITALIIGLVNEAMEVAWWQGDTANSNPNLKHFDGLIKMIDADSPIHANVTGGGYTAQSSITSSNVIAITDNMVKKLPAGLKQKKDLVMAGGWDTLEDLCVAYFGTNNFFFNGATPGPYETGEFVLPKWGIKFHALHGLTGTGRIFLNRRDNLRLGTDLENEWEQFRLWYSQDFDQMRLRIKFKAGTQVARGNEVVEYHNV